MYDRNDVPFYVLTTDPEGTDDVLDDVWTALDKMDGRGEVYVRHRGIVRGMPLNPLSSVVHLPKYKRSSTRSTLSMSTMSSYGCRTRSV
jgi:hypothetical protein